MEESVGVSDEKNIVEGEAAIADGDSAVKATWQESRFHPGKFKYLEEVVDAGERHSVVWNFFEEFCARSKTGEKVKGKGGKCVRVARCKLNSCGHRELIVQEGSTKTMLGHLKFVHKLNMKALQKESKSRAEKVKNAVITVEQYLPRKKARGVDAATTDESIVTPTGKRRLNSKRGGPVRKTTRGRRTRMEKGDIDSTGGAVSSVASFLEGATDETFIGKLYEELASPSIPLVPKEVEKKKCNNNNRKRPHKGEYWRSGRENNTSESGSSTLRGYQTGASSHAGSSSGPSQPAMSSIAKRIRTMLDARFDGETFPSVAPPDFKAFSHLKPPADVDEVVSNMLISWYMSGYYVGYYEAMTGKKEEMEKKTASSG